SPEDLNQKFNEEKSEYEEKIKRQLKKTILENNRRISGLENELLSDHHYKNLYELTIEKNRLLNVEKTTRVLKTREHEIKSLFNSDRHSQVFDSSQVINLDDFSRDTVTDVFIEMDREFL
ncbi:11087_t:CDS:2, partial [Dentiscutata heterogama]